MENPNPIPLFLKEQDIYIKFTKSNFPLNMQIVTNNSKSPGEELWSSGSQTHQLSRQMGHGLLARETFFFPSQPISAAMTFKDEVLKTLSLRLLPVPRWRMASTAQTARMLNVHRKKNLPGNVHLGAARFQEAESRVGNEIIVLTLGKWAAKLPQAKKAGSLHPFLFHLSVWMGHRKSIQWRSQHRSQISSVHMGLTF